MHKGEVVEEGDHESLMDAGGTYFGLVKRQSLRRAEEEEEEEEEQEQEQQQQQGLGLKQQKHAKLVVDQQIKENQLSSTERHGLLAPSSTPLVMKVSNDKTKNLIINEDEVEVEDAKVENEKVIVSITLILMIIILLGKSIKCRFEDVNDEQARMAINSNRMRRCSMQWEYSTGPGFCF